MNTKNLKVLFWTPRVISILFIAFISMFAFDVFEGNDPWWMKLIGLLIHLLPTFALILGLVIAWRWEWVGAAAFIGFGIWYVIDFNDQHWSAQLLLGGLPAIIGLLWLAGWLKRDQIREVHQ